MDNQQFDLLMQELKISKNQIIEKLEEIRCGLIDIEPLESLVCESIECNCREHASRAHGRTLNHWWVCPAHGYNRL